MSERSLNKNRRKLRRWSDCFKVTSFWVGVCCSGTGGSVGCWSRGVYGGWSSLGKRLGGVWHWSAAVGNVRAAGQWGLWSVYLLSPRALRPGYYQSAPWSHSLSLHTHTHTCSCTAFVSVHTLAHPQKRAPECCHPPASQRRNVFPANDVEETQFVIGGVFFCFFCIHAKKPTSIKVRSLMEV